MKKLFVLCSFFSLLSLSTIAQKFEIRSSYIDESNVAIEVRVLGQPAPKTTDYLTDLVFGIKWDGEQDLDIESVTNVGGFNIAKSDVERLDGQFEYQAFYANATPFLFSVDWRHEEWIEVVRIKFTGISLDDQMIKIAEPNFNDNTNPNFGLNLKDYNLSINGFSSSDEHYISLADFQAKTKNNDVQLYWISEIEINTEHFVVEKSHDASYWTDLGTVEAQVNSNMPSDYSFLDENAFVASKSGIVIYYRLKMVKKDGSYEYSKTQVVQQEPHYFEFAVQPTSSSSQSLNIIRSNSEESSEVYIYNYSGMLIQKSILGSQQQIFQLNDIPSGVYFVRIGDQARKVFIP
jgi:hypothetical protein